MSKVSMLCNEVNLQILTEIFEGVLHAYPDALRDTLNSLTHEPERANLLPLMKREKIEEVLVEIAARHQLEIRTERPSFYSSRLLIVGRFAISSATPSTLKRQPYFRQSYAERYSGSLFTEEDLEGSYPIGKDNLIYCELVHKGSRSNPGVLADASICFPNDNYTRYTEQFNFFQAMPQIAAISLTPSTSEVIEDSAFPELLDE